MAKKFSDNNPLKNLSGAVQAPELPQQQTSVPVSGDPGTESVTQKRKPRYLRLDITDYYDYVSLMTDHLKNKSGRYISMTQYILRLIEADKQQNLGLYQKLEQIEAMKRDVT